LALLAAASVATVAAVSVIGASPAQAVVDPSTNNVNWFLSQGAAGYKNMLDAVRARVRQPYINSVDRTASGHAYFTVDVYRSDRRRQDGPNIRVLVDTQNLYVQGVYDSDYGQYFRFNDANLRRFEPTAASAGNSFDIGFGGSYAAMERAAGGGFTMQSATLGRSNFNQIVDDVASNGTSTATRARGMIALVEAIAEGARFDYVSGRIYNGFDSGNPFRFNTEATGMVKDWSTMGKTLVRKVNNPRDTTTLHYGSLTVQSVAQFAALLALILSL
jgi:hypothetical protein